MSNTAENTSTLPEQEQLISCDTCLKSVPLSESSVSEVEEYVAYFCGLDCYDTWVHQNDKKD